MIDTYAPPKTTNGTNGSGIVTDNGAATESIADDSSASNHKAQDYALIVHDVTKGFRVKTAPNRWQRAMNRVLRRAVTSEPIEAAAKKDDPKAPVMAVNRVTFDMRRGEIFGVLGPNGSGKSTLIRVLSTLMIPDTGYVKVFGHDVTDDEMIVKRMISRVSVDAAFFKKLSPLENLLYGARLYGIMGAVAERKAVEILKRLGLKPSTFTQPMEEMSRGMQQKVAIARAFLTSPVLLLLDEPTTGLDPRSKREVRSFIEELRDTHDATILITTHDMEEAEALCDRVAVMHEGRIVAMDTPQKLKTTLPASERIAGRAPTLEDVFMSLTGSTLVNRDEEEPEIEIQE